MTTPRKPLKATKPLAKMSTRRAAMLAEQGITNPASTFLPSTARTREPRMAAPAKATKRPQYTGPKRPVCDLVDARSGKMCEFPGCTSAQDHRHHRLNRKSGGRHGEMRERLNQAAWLLGVCTIHHDIVTNPVGELRVTIERMGWVLREGQDATQVEVATRHDAEPVFLDNAGDWHRFEDVAA